MFLYDRWSVLSEEQTAMVQSKKKKVIGMLCMLAFLEHCKDKLLIHKINITIDTRLQSHLAPRVCRMSIIPEYLVYERTKLILGEISNLV